MIHKFHSIFNDFYISIIKLQDDRRIPRALVVSAVHKEYFNSDRTTGIYLVFNSYLFYIDNLKD